MCRVNSGRAHDRGMRRPGGRAVGVGAHPCSVLWCYQWRGHGEHAWTYKTGSTNASLLIKTDRTCLFFVFLRLDIWGVSSGAEK